MSDPEVTPLVVQLCPMCSGDAGWDIRTPQGHGDRYVYFLCRACKFLTALYELVPHGDVISAPNTETEMVN